MAVAVAMEGEVICSTGLRNDAYWDDVELRKNVSASGLYFDFWDRGLHGRSREGATGAHLMGLRVHVHGTLDSWTGDRRVTLKREPLGWA